jgi:WD40 repeat protein
MSRSIRWFSTLCVIFSILIGFEVTKAQESERQLISKDNVNQIEELVYLGRQGDGVSGVAFSPDNTLVASGGLDKTVRIWDVETGESLHNLRGHSASV